MEYRETLSLVEIASNLPAISPERQPNLQGMREGGANLEDIKGILAGILGINPNSIEIGMVEEKTSLEDFTNMKKTGVVYANFKVPMSSDAIATALNRSDFLWEIEINGQTGDELSAIVSGGDVLAGNLVITTKEEENQILPFFNNALGGMLGNVGLEGFNHYWNGIGGKVVGEATVRRLGMEMSGALLGQGRGRGRALGGRQRVPVPVRRTRQIDNELSW